jgi:ornithine carbamoyltransferase
MDFAVASPAGYQLSADDFALAEQMSVDGASVWHGEDPVTAVTDADVIYTDVWTSMGQEAETAERLKIFPPYQVNQTLVNHARPDCLVMHCLPAHRGEEITDEVADGPNSVLFPQAHNRMHAQKAILVELLAS